MAKAARSFSLLLITATLVGGCNFDVSSNLNNADGTRTEEELVALIRAQFAMQVDGVTADIACPTGLSGEKGRKVTCSGTTSDGFTLEIAVRERGEGAFRWSVVDSVPVGTGG